jgi:predicted nuclease of predicted toxin-antitoxin system
VKLLVDMNLSPSWCGALREDGFEAVHWSEVGDPRATDRELVHWARDHDAVVLTHDLDFGAILAATQAVAPSVVLLRTQDPTPGAMRELLAGCLRTFAADIEAGAIVAVDAAGGRVHLLPLRR